ncbi:hypothetical protein ABE036_11345 [Priestia aryabhattai]|uniref:hypothetical protein n=1 Tax=Priestia aryabhattai TaxID=412384 RepID=UPI003D2E0038
MDYIISWLYLEEKGNESSYMQVNAKSTSKKFQNVYWECVVSFYYASLQKNPAAKHIFYTNAQELPIIQGFCVASFFENNDIEIKKQELTNKTPMNWHNAWRNQFYVFDILKDLSTVVEKNDAILILDSDCIIKNSLEPLFTIIKDKGLISYLIGYDLEHNINGISTNNMRKLYKCFYNEDKDVFYYGGEFIGIKGGNLDTLLREYQLLWAKNYKLYEEKKLKLNEEAHFLSMLYHNMNLANNLGNQYIKRMWNGLNYNNLKKEDCGLSIYHLPAQKTTGFHYFFNKFVKKNKKFNQQDIINIFDISNKKSQRRKAREIVTKLIFKYR